MFNDEKASALYLEKAAQELDSATQYHAFAERLKVLKFKPEEIKKLYAGGSKLSSAHEKLSWAEGIVDVLNDRDWAIKAYKEIAPSFKTVDEKEIFETSRKIRFESKFC